MKKLSNIKKIYIQKKILWVSIIIFIFLASIAGISLFGNHSVFFASILHQNTNINTEKNAVYIAQNYEVPSNTTGHINVQIGNNFSSLAGFQAEISFPDNKIEVLDISLEGTSLENKNFFLEKNIKTPGKVSILGATGGSGISLQKDDTLFKIHAFIKDESQEGENIPITINSISLITSNLEELKPEYTSGNISIKTKPGSLQIKNLEIKTSSTMEFVFSDEITKASKDDFSFTPDITTEYTKIETIGNRILVHGLNISSGIENKVTLSDNITSNIEGSISSHSSEHFFKLSEKNNLFYITHTNNISDTIFEIYFSENINSASVDSSHFIVPNGVISDIKTDKNKVVITLPSSSSLSELEDTFIIKINNNNGFITSESSSELVSKYAFLYPTKNFFPMVKNTQSRSDGKIQINFEEPINKSSFVLSSIEIYNEQNTKNLVTPNTQYEFSDDYKSIILSNIKIDETKQYILKIKKQSITTDNDKINSYTYMESFFGKTPLEYNEIFEIKSVEANSLQNIIVSFSQEPHIDSIFSGNFILMQGDKKIDIFSTEKKGNEVFLKTPKLNPEEYYTLKLKENTWKNTSDEYIGGTSEIFFKTPIILHPQISQVEPSQITLDKEQEIIIIGKNLPQNPILYLGEVKLESIKTDTNQQRIIAKIPTDKKFIDNQYDLLLQNEGENIIFKKAVLISLPKNEIQIIESQSYASPQKIPNDGETKTTLYALVDDPMGLEDIEKVTVDLRPIDGIAEVIMEKGEIVNGKQYFTAEISVPNTVATKEEAYILTATAQNKNGVHSQGKISLFVQKHRTGGIAPIIKKSHATPQTIEKISTENNTVSFFVEVYDQDGIDNIATVRVDASSLGGKNVLLSATGEENKGAKTGFYETDEPIIVEKNITNGNYILPVTVIDKDGEEAVSSINVIVGNNTKNSPQIEIDDSYTSPDKEIKKDGKTPFKIHIKVSDPEGTDNIESVSANLEPIGLPPLQLTPGAKEGINQWFSSNDLIVPSNIGYGAKDIKISVTDKSGSSDAEDLRVYIIKPSDEGNTPYINIDRSYTTPAQLKDDGKTPFSTYIFVEDQDDDISHVVLHLGNFAKYTAETLPEGTSAKDTNGQEMCISTRTILCLQPILKEANGQWYYINHLVITPLISETQNEIEFPVIAVDETGKNYNTNFTVYLGENQFSAGKEKPSIEKIQTISDQEVQILFSAPIDYTRIKEEYFSISSSENVLEKLKILSLSKSADGRLVTLFTKPQVPNKNYTLSVDTDNLGVSAHSTDDRMINFAGYQKLSRNYNFTVKEFTNTGPETFKIRFNLPLSLSSIYNKGNIKITNTKTKEKIDIRSISFLDEKTLNILVPKQNPGQTYQIIIENISSAYSDSLPKTNLLTKGYEISGVDSLSSLGIRADFNNDKKVDFKDFTLFSAVYGKDVSHIKNGVFDFNADQSIDFSDFTLFSADYGKEVLTPGQTDTSQESIE